ncbi:hypothetical protein IKI14_05120 [bacterium]|nr:hypothetical protein [bacterium]
MGKTNVKASEIVIKESDLENKSVEELEAEKEAQKEAQALLIKKINEQ